MRLRSVSPAAAAVVERLDAMHRPVTRALARDLGPAVRVNGVAPGAILWPEIGDSAEQTRLLNRTPLARPGDPADIAGAVLYLVQAPYVTGQIVAVDGGRSVVD